MCIILAIPNIYPESFMEILQLERGETAADGRTNKRTNERTDTLPPLHTHLLHKLRSVPSGNSEAKKGPFQRMTLCQWAQKYFVVLIQGIQSIYSRLTRLEFIRKRNTCFSGICYFSTSTSLQEESLQSTHVEQPNITLHNFLFLVMSLTFISVPLMLDKTESEI